MIPLLLTSSVVAHDTGVRLKDTDERIRLAMEGIAAWLQIDSQLPLILCDGSSFDFSDLVRHSFPDALVECLSFENDQTKVRQFGRGYGEGEIVRFALNNSVLIARYGCFAKCSSKLWVQNYKQCLKSWNGRFLFKGVFLNVFSPFKKTEFAYIDTRFYVAEKSLYKDFFEDAHLRLCTPKKNGYSLEDAFHDVMLEKNITKSLTSTALVICGVGGGIGKYYKNTRIRRLKEDIRIWISASSRKFCNLFI